MSEVLTAKLAQVRRKQAGVVAATGAAMALGFVVLALGIESIVDWAVQWPWSDSAGLAWIVRAALLALILAGLGWIIFYRVLTPFIFGPDDETLALAVERKETDLGGRLIASVQLSRPQGGSHNASLSLIRALVHQTELLVQDRDFDRIIRVDSLIRTGSISLLILIVGAVSFLFCLPSSAALLRRAFLSTESVPRKTRVNVVSGDIRVARGDSVTLIAQADGVKPPSGTLEVVYPSARYNFPMDADPTTKGQYLRKIENVTASFTYAVRLNDGRSDRHYNVEVAERPAAISMDCVQIYPHYIQLPEAHHLPGDLSMVAGSRLVITIKANKPLQQTSPQQFPFNHVHLAGSDKDYPLNVDPSDATKATIADADGKRGIPLPAGTNGLSVHLVDRDGFISKDPTIFRVELVPDKPPVIRITGNEAHGEMVTRIASQHITFDAYDDYAIGRVSLRYTVNGGTQHEIPVPLDPPNPPSVSGGVFNFDLTKVNAPPGVATLEGSTIQYWLHAEDMNDVSNANHLPGMGDSETYTLKVVTEEEKRRELMSRFNVLPDELAPISEGEQKSSDSLGNLVVHGGNDSTTKPAGQ